MTITIYAKKRITKEGKTFYNYLARLTQKSTGEVITAQVKFREECGTPKPEKCPMLIEVPKTAANMSTRDFTDEFGDKKTAYTVWVSEWKQGAEFVDTSMDDYE